MLINYHKIILDIEKLIAGDVVYDNASIKKYSTDASLFTVRPQIIIFPKDQHDITQVVKYVNNLKIQTPGGLYDQLSITARAAGTCMSGGSLNDSIIVDVTKYMHKIFVKNFVTENKFIECEPGVYFRNLETFLNRSNLMYPPYPASKDLCCVGGIVANNSAGEKSLLYGQAKDWVKEIEMVLEDGTIHNFKKIGFEDISNLASPVNRGETKQHKIVQNIYKQIINLIEPNRDVIEKNKPITSKNSSGYNLWDVIDWDEETVDMCKLICGSQGTFGIITKVKLRVIEKKKYSKMLTVLMPDLNNLVPMVEEIMKYKPEAIETFDDHTFKIAIRFLPSIIWKLKGSLFQLTASFIPEAWMALTGGIPKLILMAEFTGKTQEEADEKAKIALKNVQQFKYKSRITKNEIDLQKYWLFRRESFNLLRSKLRGFRTAPFVEDIIVPIASMREFIPQMENILNKYKYTYTIAGHAGNGNFHIIPLMKMNSQAEIEDIKKTNQEVFSLVQKYHGSISAEHNDGLVRTPYLHFMFDDEMLNLFVETKNIFDPLNIFNPGKKVGGSISDNYKKIELTKH